MEQHRGLSLAGRHTCTRMRTAGAVFFDLKDAFPSDGRVWSLAALATVGVAALLFQLTRQMYNNSESAAFRLGSGRNFSGGVGHQLRMPDEGACSRSRWTRSCARC